MVSVSDPNRILICRYCDVYVKGVENLIRHEEEHETKKSEIDKEETGNMSCSRDSNNVLQAKYPDSRFSANKINQGTSKSESSAITQVVHENFRVTNREQLDSPWNNHRGESGDTSCCNGNVSMDSKNIGCPSSSHGSSSTCPATIEEVKGESQKITASAGAKEDSANDGSRQPKNSAPESLLRRLKRVDSDVDDDEIQIIDIIVKDHLKDSVTRREDNLHSNPLCSQTENSVSPEDAHFVKKPCSKEIEASQQRVGVSEPLNSAKASKAESGRVNSEERRNQDFPSYLDFDMSLSPMEPDEDEIVLAVDWYSSETSSGRCLSPPEKNDVGSYLNSASLPYPAYGEHTADALQNPELRSNVLTSLCSEPVVQTSKPYFNSLASTNETVDLKISTSGTTTSNVHVASPNSDLNAIVQTVNSSCSSRDGTASPPSALAGDGRSSFEVSDENSETAYACLQLSRVHQASDPEQEATGSVTEKSDSESETSDNDYLSPCPSTLNSTSNPASTLSISDEPEVTAAHNFFPNQSTSPISPFSNSVSLTSDSVLEASRPPPLYTFPETSDAEKQMTFLSKVPRTAHPVPWNVSSTSQASNPFSSVSLTRHATVPYHVISNASLPLSAPPLQPSEAAPQISASAQRTSTIHYPSYASHSVPDALNSFLLGPSQRPATFDPQDVAALKSIIQSGGNLPAATLYESFCEYIETTGKKVTGGAAPAKDTAGSQTQSRSSVFSPAFKSVPKKRAP